jgi:putative transposase
MPRLPRAFKYGYCYHITVRCNNRAFNLRRKETHMFILHALQRVLPKFEGQLYGVAIMSNHVHYLLQTKKPSDISKLMHWLNWYTAISINRLLQRTGHFWESRYSLMPVSNDDNQHVLNVLRYIHGNPYAAGISKGFRDSCTNYGSYASGILDGITTWHKVFLSLSSSMESCSKIYREHCSRYSVKPKHVSHSGLWGKRLLAGLRSEMIRKKEYGRNKSDQQSNLFHVKGVSRKKERNSTILQSSYTEEVMMVPGTAWSRKESAWLNDPIRAVFRTFKSANAPNKRYPIDVPLKSKTLIETLIAKTKKRKREYSC